ncbi:uncharacterized protein LOC127880103 [Dreissena polymorpha]|uniref:TIR domain-containing protein n=1 Tax=Dreissena polymorpha TaxID=45954 RepID=A0A9D4KIQ1_DREPO|nr:uncharacterized protein LOC127880103 [Dreissena polymorpha]KAH3840608.1 hypothetical protein DPMN_114060 [Dreissena polymorpha]
MSTQSKNKPPVQRPSEMFIELTRQAEWDEFHLEKQALNKSQLFQQYLRGYEEVKTTLSDVENKTRERFSFVNMVLRDKVVDIFPMFDTLEERTVVGNKLARLGLVETLEDYYDYIMDDLSLTSLTDAIVLKYREDSGMRTLLTIRRLLWDYSDSCHTFSESVADSGLFQKLMLDLHLISQDGLGGLQSQIENDSDLFIFSSAVSILYNSARNPFIEKERFRQYRTVEKMRVFLKCQCQYIQMISLLAMANIIRENEVPDLTTEFDVVSFITDAILAATQAKDRRVQGFHVTELVDGLTALCQHDDVRRKASRKPTLHLVLTILSEGSPPEKLAVLKLMWEMSFLGDSRKKILAEEDLTELIRELTFHNNLDVKCTAKKAMFVLSQKDDRVIEVECRPVDERVQPHVMISYHWGDRTKVIEIYHVLRAEGYNIWIDVEEVNKYPDVTNAMTSSIEDANVVLVFMSEKYKNSRNCRTELEYAFELKKIIVPLLVQQNYKADGWLRDVIGENPGTIDFTRFTHSKMHTLRQILQKDQQAAVQPLFRSPSRVKSRAAVALSTPRGTSRMMSRASILSPANIKSAKQVLDWTADDIQQWAMDFKLEGRAFRTVAKMNGAQIYFVFENWIKNPARFCHWIETTMHLGSVEDLMRFRNAIKALVTYTT